MQRAVAVAQAGGGEGFPENLMDCVSENTKQDEKQYAVQAHSMLEDPQGLQGTHAELELEFR